MGALAVDMNIVIALLTAIGLPVGYFIGTLTKTEVQHARTWLIIASKALSAAVLCFFIYSTEGTWVAVGWTVAFFLLILPANIGKFDVMSIFLLFYTGLLLGILHTSPLFVIVASIVFVDCLVWGSLQVKNGRDRMIIDVIALLVGVLGGVSGFF